MFNVLNFLKDMIYVYVFMKISKSLKFNRFDKIDIILEWV